jgi:hypothetical protein
MSSHFLTNDLYYHQSAEPVRASFRMSLATFFFLIASIPFLLIHR